MKRRELLQRISECGAQFKREGGSHAIYENPRTREALVVPRHTEISPGVSRKVLQRGCERDRDPDEAQMAVEVRSRPKRRRRSLQQLKTYAWDAFNQDGEYITSFWYRDQALEWKSRFPGGYIRQRKDAWDTAGNSRRRPAGSRSRDDVDLSRQSAESLERLYNEGRVSKRQVVQWVRLSAKHGHIYQPHYRTGAVHDRLWLQRREDLDDTLFAKRKARASRSSSRDRSRPEGGKSARFYVEQDRPGWSAYLVSSRGRILNAIHDDVEDGGARVHAAAKRAWPHAREVKGEPKRTADLYAHLRDLSSQRRTSRRARSARPSSTGSLARRSGAPSRMTARQRAFVSRKIRILRREGYKQDQAVAVALRMAGVPPRRTVSTKRRAGRRAGRRRS